MEKDKLEITKKNPKKGEDGYKTFSIRVKDETVKVLDKISEESHRSRNELINMILEYGINNYEIIE